MIYCVEDDASIRELVIYTLQATGYEAQGFADGKSYSDLVSQLIYGGDQYMLIADYRAYADTQRRLYDSIRDPQERGRLSIMNTARSGVFAADRAIREYAENIWNLK